MSGLLSAFLVWLGTSWAAPSINLPSVADSGDGTALYLGSGAAFLRYGPLPTARVALDWQSEDWNLRASSTTYLGTETERFDVLGGTWAMVDRDRVRFGPALSFAQHTGTSAIDHRVTGRAGLSVDTGGERLRFDATISMVGMGWYPRGEVVDPLYRLPIFDTLLVTELGLRRAWGDHQLRLGLFGPMPTLGYQWQGRPWLVRVDGSTMGDQHGLWVQLGRHL